MQKVEIEWIDSKAGPNEWEHREGLEPLQPVKCKTIGFLLEDAAAHKTVSQSLSASQVHGRISIPTGCIVKIRKLR